MAVYRAEKAVLSKIHIKHLIDMTPREIVGQDLSTGVDTWKAGLTLSKQIMRRPSHRKCCVRRRDHRL